MERYGPDFLRVIQKHTGTNGTQGNRQPPPPPISAVQRDNREFPADKEADRFFVYITSC